MKRKNDLAAAARAKGKVKEAKRDELCPYFDNLPSHITVHILLQLPLKSLLICKCVCKNWKTMISEPDFAKLHFEQAPTSLMIRSGHTNKVARTMHLLEKFEIGINNRVKLEPIFKIPLRDARSIIEKRLNNHNIKRKQRLDIACIPDNDKFKVVNSCNGFLCLCRPYYNIPFVICNPITGEFIRLPITLNSPRIICDRQAAFGFHSKTNEYKVLNMWRRTKFKSPKLMLEIHTLGTLLWRNVEVDLEISIWNLQCLTCVNDTLHWIRHDDGKRSILCFSFESERFQSFSSPPHAYGNIRDSGMEELRGFLYFSDVSLHDVTLWVMNEYGIEESWTKVYNIDTSVVSFHLFRRRCDPWPIKHFKVDAALLLYHSSNCFIYFETEKNEFKVFEIHGTHSKCIEVISHIPSLISLKDVVKGDNIEVLNIHSRCAKFKLLEDDEIFSLSRFV